jgi:hypothetical protein
MKPPTANRLAGVISDNQKLITGGFGPKMVIESNE